MNNEDKTILYLDDEPENLDGFKFIFYKDYKIYTAQNVLEALNIIRNHPIKVILSDNKMPDMLGTEFFEMLTTSNPDIIRILVTAYVDTEAAMQAINKGQVYRFITKPWEKNELKATLENAFEAYNLKTQNQELIENLTRKNFELEDLNFRLMIEVSERKKVEEELYMHRNHLEELVKKRTQEIEKINQELTLYKEKLEKLVKERTEQLLESEQRIKTINDNLPGGAIFRGYTKPDNTDHLVYASNQIAEVTGISLDELLISIGHFFNNINREDIPLLVEARNESLKNFQPLDVELRYNKNDEIIWLHLRMMFSKSNDDNIWWDGYVIDITNRKIAEKAAKEREATINKIHEGIATKTGEKLLETIVIKLWETLKADSVFIGLPIKNNTIIRTTILCIDGKITKNFEYNIENSPCQIVLNNFTLSYRSGVYNHYPDSQLLKTFSAEGYIGTPLHNSAGSCIGILVALYKKTIVELKQAEQLLDIFSSRIGAEIERINAENEIQLYSDVALNMQVGLNVFQIEKNKNKYILKLIKANPAAEKITRLQLKNMVGMTFEEIYPQLKSYELHKDVIKVINSGSPYINEEFKFFSENGKLFFYNIKAFPVPNDRVGILFEDITRKKLTEKTIKESEEKYRALFDKSPNGIYLVGTNNPHSGKIVSANSKIAQMLGYEISELIGSPVENIIPEITYQKRLEYTSKLMSNESVVFETNIYRSDGQTFQVEITTSTVSLGDEIFLLSIVRDITEIKNAEKKLKENIQFLSTLLETIPIPIAYKNTKQEFIGCNTYYEKFIGLKRNEIIGKTVLDIFPKEYASRFYESDNELLTRQKIQKFENKILNANKEEKNIIVNKATFTDSQEQIAGIIEVLFDITELKKAQQIISDSQQKLLNIFNSSSDGIIITDFEYNTIDVNETLLKMLDIDWKKTKKINLYQYIPSDYHPFFKDILKKFNKGITSVHNEIEIFNSNKKHIAVEIYCKLINLEGKPAILNMIRDITERKNIEKRLLETIINTEEKERERFAGNLHDEVGPLLSSLKMYVSLINENTDKEKITYILDQINTLIREAIQTVREISNDLSPHVLNNYGFIAAINSYISIKKDFIKIDFKHNIGTKRYTSNIETILYRIVKELINNTIKHADAKKINISIIEKNNSINLDYKDDGKGFEFKNDMELKPGSIGIINIISRIKTINGKYTLKTSKERGFNFTLSVPLV